MSPEGSQSPDPAPEDSLAAKLKARFGEGVDPGVSLHAAEESGEKQPDFSSALVTRLSGRSGSFGRYRVKGEIARGGMGAILKIWDEDLHRHLAMKVILGQVEGGKGTGKGETPPIETAKLARFLEEAQVTGQLDHPGIVPVHELGLDPQGRVYFTMKLVKGQSLKEVFDLVAEGKEGWSQTKALGVLLKVCEAMAYAHDKGVIHRDLKPPNVMVGKFGEVHVMDWGLARILGREDEKDIRIREEAPRSSTELRSERDEHRGETPESPLYTMDGDVVGTPAYMPPEQAAGRVTEMGPHSDVYALGAMLYHLIAGHMPYVPSGARLNNYAVWGLVQQGPPTPIAQLAGETPAELVAICEKAMARDWKRRYCDVSELAADLSAYLEHRVVGAYETGAWAETKKWVERNKALAASLAAAMLILVAGIIGIAAQNKDLRTANTTINRQNFDLSAATKLAQQQELLATQKTNDVLSLSAIQDLKDLEDRADALWPPDPELVPKYEAWLADARILIEGQPADLGRGLKKRPSLADHEAKLAEIRRRTKPLSAEDIEGDASERQTYEFEDGEDRWWHAQLSKLVSDLKAFTDKEKGGLYSSGTSEEHGWGIVRRAEFARTIGERSVNGVEAKKRWSEAISAIAASTKYGGVKLEPQLGLLPIGADPESGLWEFSHLATGEKAERGSDGRLILKETIGLVFVLIPGGTFRMGAQREEPTAPNYDPQAAPDESPVHEVILSPYFLSKYEMTQGQWERFTRRNPSQCGPGTTVAGHQHSLLHPVEQVTWTQCVKVMTQLELTLPSEAQWENGCRGNTDAAWWTGAEHESLRGKVNIADQAAIKAGATWPAVEPSTDLEDGWVAHAAVGSFPANPFGLHEVIGNVRELCMDCYDGSFYASSPKTNPVAPPTDSRHRIAGGALRRVDRGGSFASIAQLARSACRDSQSPEDSKADLGLRPARALQSPASQPHPAGN